MNEEETRVQMTTADLILIQLKDLKNEFRESRKELSERMSRLEKRQDKFEEQLGKTNERIERLNDKLDKLNEKLDGKIESLRRDTNSSSRHGQIADISTIGIALAVIYFVATH